MVEGEEEVGSPHLPAFARRHPALFRGDGATIEGAGHTPEGVPEALHGEQGHPLRRAPRPDGGRGPAQLPRRVAAEPGLAAPGRAPHDPRRARARPDPGLLRRRAAPDARGARPPPPEPLRPAGLAEGLRGHRGLRGQDAPRAAGGLLLQPDLQHRRPGVRLHGTGEQDHQSGPRLGEARLSPAARSAAAPDPGRPQGAPPPEGVRRRRGHPAQHLRARRLADLVGHRAGPDRRLPGRVRAAAGGLPLDGRLLLDVLLHEPRHAGGAAARASATAAASSTRPTSTSGSRTRAARSRPSPPSCSSGVRP